MTYVDPLERLTIAELDAGSRYLKTDLVTAIAEDRAEKWGGLALVAWILAKRDDPTAQLAPYREMSANDLYRALGVVEDDPDGADLDSGAVSGETAPDDASGGAEATPEAAAVGDSAAASGDLLADLDVEAALTAAADPTTAPDAEAAPLSAAEEREALRARIVADPMGRHRG